MRTDEDIRAAFATLERHAPDPDAILCAVRARTGAGPAAGIARRWRRGRWLAAAAAVSTAAAAAAAIAATALGTAEPASVSLAAWTVHADADGDVTLTVRQEENLPALQATLRADGVRADVRLHAPTAAEDDCLARHPGENPWDRILSAKPEHGAAHLVIHRDAIPAGDTLVFYLHRLDPTSVAAVTAVVPSSSPCPG